MRERENAKKSCTCIPLNALSANLLMELYEKSSFVIGKLADANVYDDHSLIPTHKGEKLMPQKNCPYIEIDIREKINT